MKWKDQKKGSRTCGQERITYTEQSQTRTPPGAPESIRHERVVTLMTDAEFEKLTKLSHENEKSVSALVHQLVSRYLKRRG